MTRAKSIINCIFTVNTIEAQLNFLPDLATNVIRLAKIMNANILPLEPRFLSSMKRNSGKET